MLPASNHGPGQNFGFPDVCLTPAVPPVPIPYPNFGSNSLAVPTAPNVLISGMPGQNMGSMPVITNGDNAGCIHPLGMMKPGGTTMGNPTVMINGLPSKHLLCPSQGNLFNDPIGATLIPDVVNVLYSDLGDAALVDLCDLPDTSLGLTASPTSHGLRVLHTRRGGLAARLGLRPGDVVLEQDGRRLRAPSDLRQIAPGRVVELRVTRPGERPRLLRGRQLARRLPPVERTRLGPRAARLVLRRVSRVTPSLLRRELGELTARGVRELELDLRGNPGGSVAAAAALASAFLPAEREVARLELGGQPRTLRTLGAPAWAGGLTVLVDGQTASAAELLAGALQAHDRAPLVGARTYGKVQVAALGRGPVGHTTSLSPHGLVPDASPRSRRPACH
ncbi:MAG: S41 family peptidase [Planctomycetota bacterium]